MIILGRFTKNTIITFATRLITAVFSVLITVIIGRSLSSEGLGIYSLAILLPSFLLTFSNFGLNTASVFYIGRKKYSAREVLGNNIIFALIISVFVFLIGLVIVFFFGFKLFPGVKSQYLILALTLIPLYLLFDFISQVLLGLQKLKKYNLASFLQNFFLFLLILILILGLKLGVGAAIWGQVISMLIVLSILIFIIKKETGGLFSKFNKDYLKDAFSYGFKAYLGSVFDFLNHKINIFLINFFIRNPVVVGFFYVATRLNEGIWMFSISASTVLFPKVASQNDPKQLKEFTPFVYRNILLFTFFVVLILFFLSRWIIVFLYSGEFLESVNPFRILLLGTLFISGWVILTNDISARGKPMLTTCIIGFSALVNILLSMALIPKFGIIGAAWATTISYFVMFLLTIVIYSRVSGNKITEIIFPQKRDMEFYRIILLRLKSLKRR